MGKLLTSGPNQAAQERLIEVLSKQSPLALVGAGMSVGAGFPTWKQLLDQMEKQLESVFNEDYLKALHNEQDLLWRAEEYRILMGEPEYQTLLRNKFSKDIALKKTDPVVKLIKLPFRHFITTNYEDVLLKAHEMAGMPAPRFLNWFRETDVRAFIFGLRDGTANGRFVLHLHGHHSEPSSIIFTDNDYTERYVRTFETASKLFAIFTTERVVFFGFSLSDPDLMALFREVNAIMRSDEARHFAILGLNDPKREMLERKRLRKRYGVEPVFYDTSDGNHDGLIEILDQLHDRIGKSTSVEKEGKALALSGSSGISKKDGIIRGAASRKLKEEAADENVVVIDPDDPQKGKWGGKDAVNGRKVTATVREIEPDWFETTITVVSTDPRKPLKGKVYFYLHPTIIPSIQEATVKNGVAVRKIESYGAYTVGVKADNGKTRLELDLSTIEDAPLMFRMN